MARRSTPATAPSCRVIRRLGLGAGNGDVLPGPLAGHAAACLRCQAELARYRRLKRELAGLATETMQAPQRVMAEVDALIESRPLPHPQGSSAKTAATLAGAAAAAAGVIAVAMWRRSRVLAWPAS